MKISNKLSNLPKVKASDIHNLQGDLKKLSNKNYEKLKKRIENVGFKYPLYLWKNEGKWYNLDGNQRLKTILRAFGDIELPYVEIEADSIVEAKKEILAISSEYGEVTEDGFKEFTSDFLAEDWGEIDTQTTFEGWNLNQGQVEDDGYEIKENIEVDVSIGDVIKIGEHRLMCGDSTNMDDYENLLQGDLFDMIVTDPPYNVDYTGKTKDALKIENDSMNNSDFYQFLLDFYSAAYAFTRPGGSWYIWHSDSEGENFRRAMRESGVKVRQCLIWNKNSMVMGRQDYHWKHEPCLYGWKDGASHKWYSDRKQTTVLEFDRPIRNAEHPTMKPVDLIAYQINNSTEKNDIVGDPFIGSGTTMVASEQLGRRCYGMEIDPKYCQVVINRMNKLFPEIKIKINDEEYRPRQSSTD